MASHGQGNVDHQGYASFVEVKRGVGVRITRRVVGRGTRRR